MMGTKQLLKKTRLKVLPDTYAIVRLPLNQFSKLDLRRFQKNFFSIIYEKKEITLILDQKNWNMIKKDFTNYKIQRNYRILTLDVNLEWDVVGYLASVSKALADKNIPLGVLSGYSTDHLSIRNKDVKNALNALRTLKND